MGEYQFKLYITGHTSRSELATNNLRALCERHLAGRYEVEVIDVMENPQDAEDQRILATPMLIKTAPPPVSRVLGDLSDNSKVLVALGIAKSDLREVQADGQ